MAVSRFTTRSKRILLEAPKTVANRRITGDSDLLSAKSTCSDITLVLAYSDKGFGVKVSSAILSLVSPYTLQEEANTNLLTLYCSHTSARILVAKKFKPMYARSIML